MPHKPTRRQFMQTTAAASVGFWAAGGVSLAQNNSPNEKIRFACIGVGGKGSSDTEDASKHGDVVAICDIDDKTLANAARRYPKAKKFNDYRKMFDEIAGDIDAVTVSTPDHSHAPAAVMAMKHGKHAFCQKPLTHSLHEARVMAEVAREKKLATQMGNQGTAGSGLRKGAAIVRAGALGKVKEVYVWTDRPIWDQGIPRPAEEPVPANVHWDLFIGPAPMRPYGKGYHPFSWRGWWDFGTGSLGDMACHTMNLPFMALNLRDPISVEAQSSENNKDSYPDWTIIKYEFPELDGRPALSMTWYDKKKKPPKEVTDELMGGKELAQSGSLIIGEKGALYSPGDYGDTVHLLGGVEEPKVEFPRSPGHFTEYAEAIKTGKPAMSNFPDYSGALTETVLLGNLAVWHGGKVEWDAKNQKATNTTELEPLIRPKYREGYTL